MFDTRLVCRKPRLASGCVVASADVISVDSVSADAVAVSAASVTRCLGRFMVVLTEDSGAAADMALLAHGFALYHLVKQDRRTPVVTSLRDRVFNRRPSLRCRRSCREIHPALQGALLLWCRVALCGRYLTLIEIPTSNRRSGICVAGRGSERSDRRRLLRELLPVRNLNKLQLLAVIVVMVSATRCEGQANAT